MAYPVYEPWTVIREIGAGSFGTVYEIERRDSFDVYRAALKVIRIPAAPNEVEAVRSSGMSEDSVSEYFQSEAEEIVKEIKMMARFKGITNIVSYEDHVVKRLEDGISWEIMIRMELLTSLNKYLVDHPISRQGIIRLGIDICNALERCQKFNIIHRDIKPDNIFVSSQGDFKLGDFGIARIAEKTLSGMSRKGTPSYMAPEVYKGEPYGHTVDIYSLGILMYRLLNNNRIPFLPPYPQTIRYKDQEQAMVMRMSGEPMPFPSEDHGRLAEIAMKACSYLPKDRYSSAARMREELEEILVADNEMQAGEEERPVPLPNINASGSTGVSQNVGSVSVSLPDGGNLVADQVSQAEEVRESLRPEPVQASGSQEIPGRQEEPSQSVRPQPAEAERPRTERSQKPERSLRPEKSQKPERSLRGEASGKTGRTGSGKEAAPAHLEDEETQILDSTEDGGGSGPAPKKRFFWVIALLCVLGLGIGVGTTVLKKQKPAEPSNTVVVTTSSAADEAVKESEVIGQKPTLSAEEEEASRAAESSRAAAEEASRQAAAEESSKQAAAEESSRQAAAESSREALVASIAESIAESEKASKLAEEESSRQAAEAEASKQAAESAAAESAEASRIAAEESSRQAAEEASRLAAEESSRLVVEESSRQAAEESSRKAAEESRIAAMESSIAASLAESIEASRQAVEEESSRQAAEESRIAALESSIAASLAESEEASRQAAEEEARKIVPDVTGKSREEAAALIREDRPVVYQEEYSDTVEAGTIISQTPSVTETFEGDEPLVLTVSLGREPVDVLYYVGMRYSDIGSVLESAGLKVQVKEEYSDTIAQGVIMQQTPESGETVLKGDTLELVVSKGYAPFEPVSFADYTAAQNGETVTLEVVAQDWGSLGYLQDEGKYDVLIFAAREENGALSQTGGISVRAKMTEEELGALYTGEKMIVRGAKTIKESEVSREEYVTASAFQMEDGTNGNRLTPADVTEILGTEELNTYLNTPVSFRQMEVLPADSSAPETAVISSQAENGKTVFTAAAGRNGAEPLVSLQADDTLPDTEGQRLATMENLKTGDLVDVEGYLVSTAGVDTVMVSKITVTGNRLEEEAAAAASKQAEESAAAASKQAEESAAAASKQAEESAAAASKQAEESAAAASKQAEESAAAASQQAAEEASRLAAEEESRKAAEAASTAASIAESESAAAAAAVEVADYVGMKYAEIEAVLSKTGLKIRTEEVYSDTAAAGVIISQGLAANTSAKAGDELVLTVSKGPEEVVVADYTGAVYSEIKAAAEASGLTVKTKKKNSDTVPEGSVISQKPKAGSTAHKGDKLTLTISKGPAALENPARWTTSNLSFRQQADSTSTKIGDVSANTEVELLDTNEITDAGGHVYAHIRYDGQDGYVLAENLSDGPLRWTTGKASFRAKADSDSEKLDNLSINTEVVLLDSEEITDKSGNVYSHIRYEEQEGYALSSLLTDDQSVAAAAARAASSSSSSGGSSGSSSGGGSSYYDDDDDDDYSGYSGGSSGGWDDVGFDNDNWEDVGFD